MTTCMCVCKFLEMKSFFFFFFCFAIQRAPYCLRPATLSYGVSNAPAFMGVGVLVMSE